MADLAKYRLASPAYLRMKGSAGDPIYLEEGTEVGPGTPWDFEGTLTPSMTPLNEAAVAERKAFDDGQSPADFTLKGTGAPSEGGAAPFDPAKSSKDSTAEKEAAAAEKAEMQKKMDAMQAELDRLRGDKSSSSGATGSPGPTGGTGATGGKK